MDKEDAIKEIIAFKKRYLNLMDRVGFSCIHTSKNTNEYDVYAYTDVEKNTEYRINIFSLDKIIEKNSEIYSSFSSLNFLEFRSFHKVYASPDEIKQTTPLTQKDLISKIVKASDLIANKRVSSAMYVPVNSLSISWRLSEKDHSIKYFKDIFKKELRQKYIANL